MSNPEFEPKIGKPRSGREIKSGRLTRMVVKATTRHRAPKSPWANALTRRPVAELGRGKGALYGLTPPPPGWRRVIVKARIARHGTSDLAAARTHQHYIMRDGVTRDGGPGQLYDREHDVAEGGDFLERQKGDTYQFRLIVAPEDGGRMADLKPFVRDLMRDMEEDLRTKLDWVAVDHFNTGHPHTHIVIAGHDDRGQDLVMARHYISHGIRHRAQDLVTLELGPEQQFERIIKLANEMKAERFTSLDRGILKDAKENVLVVSAMPDGARGRSERRRRRATQHAGRPAAAAGADGIGGGEKNRRLGHRSPARNQAAQPGRARRHHGHHEPGHARARHRPPSWRLRHLQWRTEIRAGHRARRRGRHRRRDDRPQVSRRRRHRRPHPLRRDGQACGPRHPRAGDDRRAVGRWRQRQDAQRPDRGRVLLAGRAACHRRGRDLARPDHHRRDEARHPREGVRRGRLESPHRARGVADRATAMQVSSSPEPSHRSRTCCGT